jgi:hypothetical protein
MRTLYITTALRNFIAAIALVCASATLSHAQSPSKEQQRPRILMMHVAPAAQQLPLPGTEVELAVSLKNTRDLDRPLRAIVVRDGQRSEEIIPKATFNFKEEPTYKLVTESPLGELSYQFILYLGDGTAQASERYVVRRPCLPDVSIAPSSPGSDVQGDQRVLDMIQAKDALEREIKVYEHTRATLVELKELLKK